ncbi:hypothetical protein AHMF7605_11910 [Adhaeribacter arboris]|uniref:Uncharacterized protein n=1 Tax=Adhaeribacter arboris TaxID=2072846 RepID=A0A2T2YF77_9BACT|nr:hypothetical protein [Adhaeribacter arboris]PSR54176.1 hypothetical protein AHMF7605_11910 [Adhaeribacter arboris]
MTHPQFLEIFAASPVWERFDQWYFHYKFSCTQINQFKELSQSFQLAAIVDWLDTIGIHVAPDPQKDKWISKVKFINNGRSSFCYGEDQTTRPDALRAGIVEATKYVK